MARQTRRRQIGTRTALKGGHNQTSFSISNKASTPPLLRAVSSSLLTSQTTASRTKRTEGHHEHSAAAATPARLGLAAGDREQVGERVRLLLSTLLLCMIVNRLTIRCKLRCVRRVRSTARDARRPGVRDRGDRRVRVDEPHDEHRDHERRDRGRGDPQEATGRDGRARGLHRLQRRALREPAARGGWQRRVALLLVRVLARVRGARARGANCSSVDFT